MKFLMEVLAEFLLLGWAGLGWALNIINQSGPGVGTGQDQRVE